MAKYSDLTHGQIEAMVNKLGGMEGVRDFLSGKTYVKPFVPFPTWKWIMFGINTNLDKYLAAFEEQGCYLNKYNHTDQLIPNLQFSGVKEFTKLELVKVSVKQLGFPDGASYEDIVKAAKRERLQLCPIELIFALRLDYRDSKIGQIQLEIATVPVKDPNTNAEYILSFSGKDTIQRHRVGKDASNFSYAFEFIFCRRVM